MRKVNNHTALITTLLLCGVTLGGCQGDGGSSSIPLPVGWHRLPIEISDSMNIVKGLPMEVSVNPMAVYEIQDSVHPSLTIKYPSVGADIYFTFIKPESESARKNIIDARQERISLNLNGVKAKTLHGSVNDETDAVLVVATSGTQTPVQLLVNTPEYVVTATAFIHDPKVSQAYDSIKPLIEVLEYDMSHALRNVNFDN